MSEHRERLLTFPTLAEMRAWDLPPGTIIEARSATVIYPGGRRESWRDIERHLAKQRQAQPEQEAAA